MLDSDRGSELPPRGASPRTPRVFLSWSRDPDDAEHTDRVFQLANDLRRGGVDAHLDLYEVSPAEG